jgi:hypothetical protein
MLLFDNMEKAKFKPPELFFNANFRFVKKSLQDYKK